MPSSSLLTLPCHACAWQVIVITMSLGFIAFVTILHVFGKVGDPPYLDPLQVFRSSPLAAAKCCCLGSGRVWGGSSPRSCFKLAACR